MSDFNDRILQVIHKQEKAFRSGKTLNKEFRLAQLNNLITLFTKNEGILTETLRADYKKPIHEIRIEIFYCISRAQYAYYNLHNWMKGESVSNDMINMSASLSTCPEPYGNVLILAPWNFPYILSFEPLIGAIAAGNTVVLKTSELVPKTGDLIKRLITEYLDNDCYTVITDEYVNEGLTNQKFDFVFFTGSTRVGKLIYKSLSENLTPCVMELGGQCPCYVHSDADIEATADKIAWIKTINAGQLCVSINHVICHKSILNELIENIIKSLHRFYTTNIKDSSSYGSIVNEAHTSRLKSLIDNSDAKKMYGGACDVKSCYVEPTIFLCENQNSNLLKEEIFGPILPIIGVENEQEAVEIIRSMAKPLEVYLFTYDKNVIDTVRTHTSSGGLVVNQAYVNMAAMDLPFGGVGASGFGRYHGVHSFKCFSNYKSIFHEKYSVRTFDRLLYPPIDDLKASLIERTITKNYFKGCSILR